MALVKKNRVLQYPLVAEFVFNLSDTMAATDGVVRAFSATGAAAIFDVIGLPPNAVVISGDVTVETVSNDSGTATVKVGDSVSDARYLGATTIKTAARTALVPTGFRGAGEDIRLTFANANGDATTGKVTVRVTYLITGRANEVQVS
jgi:hypothetical protein